MIDDVLSRLPDARRVGNGYTARCPAHDDVRPSLSISEGDDGRVLICCHAGCETGSVVSALGLALADLFPRPTGAESQAKATPLATYDYVDENGVLRYQVLRRANKKFSQRRPDGYGGYIYKITGVPKLVYNLPALKGQSSILIVEGEKDVDTMRRHGLVATTNSGGAGKWGDEHTKYLRAAGVQRVAIIPDNDEAGRRHAETVAASCERHGIEATVVTLPGLAEHGDVSDFLMTKTKQDLLDAMARAERPDAAAAPLTVGALRLTTLADVEAEEIDWLWPSRLARGKATIVCGNPGDGKSRLTFDLAARVTRGALWPDGGRSVEGNVLMLLAEDGLGDTVRPGIESMGGDCNRIHILEGIDERSHTRPANLAQDLARINEALERSGPVLMVIDPITAYLGGVDSYKDSDVRGVLAPLLALVARHRCALLLVAHLNKQQTSSAIYRVGGSIGFIAAVRTAFAVGVHPDDPETRVMAQIKNNVSAPAPSLAYRLPHGMVEWQRGTVDIDAETLFARPTKKRSKLDDAEDYVRGAVAEGPVESDVLKRGAAAAGIAIATLQRAKDNLGVQAKRQGFGANGKWFVLPPDNDHLSAYGRIGQNPHASNDSALAEDDQLIIFEDGPFFGPNSSSASKDDQHGGDGGHGGDDDRQ